MKNTKNLAILVTLVGVSVVSAYYDQYGNWRQDVVTENILDPITGGRASDAPQDTQKRKEASYEREDKQRKANREYQKKQAKIQEQKEKRRGVKRQ